MSPALANHAMGNPSVPLAVLRPGGGEQAAPGLGGHRQHGTADARRAARNDCGGGARPAGKFAPQHVEHTVRTDRSTERGRAAVRRRRYARAADQGIQVEQSKNGSVPLQGDGGPAEVTRQRYRELFRTEGRDEAGRIS